MRGEKNLQASVVSGTRYQVVRALGRGGMGNVYEVEHLELRRRFVLKILHDNLASQSAHVARMRNEWRALAQLNHPHIVQVTDAGHTDEGLPYFVMEYLEGETLSLWLKRRKRLSPQEAGELLLPVLDGLHCAHEMGIIHRDIKPQNLYFTSSGQVKILDFGIAKMREPSEQVVTLAGAAIGTPRFMSPEQAAGKQVDHRTDIYSLGLVLYEMLLGQGPFDHWRDARDWIDAHIHELPDRVDWVDDRLSEEWGDLLQRWLAKDPACRPFSAKIAAQELSALLNAHSKQAPKEEFEAVTRAGVYDATTQGFHLGSSPVEGKWQPEDFSTSFQAEHSAEAPTVSLSQTEDSFDRSSRPLEKKSISDWELLSTETLKFSDSVAMPTQLTEEPEKPNPMIEPIQLPPVVPLSFRDGASLSQPEPQALHNLASPPPARASRHPYERWALGAGAGLLFLLWAGKPWEFASFSRDQLEIHSPKLETQAPESEEQSVSRESPPTPGSFSVSTPPAETPESAPQEPSKTQIQPTETQVRSLRQDQTASSSSRQAPPAVSSPDTTAPRSAPPSNPTERVPLLPQSGL